MNKELYSFDRLTTDTFIAKAKEVHGDKYSYEQTVFKDCYTKVCIVCPQHGPFLQKPGMHLVGHGCRKCGYQRNRFKGSLTQEEFIQRAHNVWGDKYDYSKTIYRGYKEKVCVTCKKHGDFYQLPPNHLNAHYEGCPQCSAIKKRMEHCGVGVMDEPTITNRKAYLLWQRMITRCYNKKAIERSKSYEQVLICKDWLLFSSFKKWYEDNYIEGYDLDKDILSKGESFYSPDTCCFIPHRLNVLLTNHKRSTKGLSVGVIKLHHKYSARCFINGKTQYIGLFSTEQEAREKYREVKSEYVKQVANEYYEKGLITQRVFNGILSMNLFNKCVL